MKSVTSALFGLALMAQSGLAHVAVLPPFPDKRLTPNSTIAPEGCKLLPSDKGYPHPYVFRDAFPEIFKKMNGTYGPDFMLQVTSVEEVQRAVKFAHEHNIRLSVVSTGHDFGGRSEARSGLRIDMGAMREPTVFSNTWQCGKKLMPRNEADEEITHEIQTCGYKKDKDQISTTVPLRNNEFMYFEKREGWDCDRLLDHHRKRQMSGMDMEGMGSAMGVAAMEAPGAVPAYNKIKVTGDHAYARVSGGMYNEMFFTQASKSGLMTLGAQHNGVSVTGGWFQAGGHNPFANKFGMQVDNVVEVELVTTDGKFRKVSECNEPDLFWAIRGGGGSTFGIVTAITVKVFPTFPVVVSRFFVNSTSKAGIAKASAHFLQVGSELRDKHGLQGYFYIYPGSFQSVLHMPAEFATMKNAKAVTEPLMKKLEELAGSTSHIEPEYFSHKTYMDWYVAEMGDEEGEEMGTTFHSWSDGSDGSAPSLSQAMANPISILPWYVENPSYPEKRDLIGPSARNNSPEKRAAAKQKVMMSQPIPRHYLDSRLLSDKMVNSVSLEKLADAIYATMPDIAGCHFRGFLYGGGKMAKMDPESTGLLPAWRDMSYHFIINAVPGSIRRDYDIGPIAKLFPEAGAYVNEASPGEPHWKKVFWGAHYPKLEQIKKKYDPYNVLWCSPCVGADVFTYDDERICPNPNYPEKDGVPAPQTYPSRFTKTGINSLPGVPGIDQPFINLIMDYETDHKLPAKMLKSSFFKMAMGEGGSAGGKYKDDDPFHPGQKFKPGDWAIN